MDKAFMFKVLTLTVSCFVIGTTWAASLHANEKVADKMAMFVSCEYTEYMLGDVPNPFNCSQYFTCSHGPPEGSQLTIPEVRPCPDDLYFDYRSCACEFSDEGCFDAEIHGLRQFFNCTIPLSSEITEAPVITSSVDA